MDNASDIAELYTSDPESEDSRLDRHKWEHDLTWRFLDRYLPQGWRILEIGCATGRFKLELARRGYDVTAVDMPAFGRISFRRM